MIALSKYIKRITSSFPELDGKAPWWVTGRIGDILIEKIGMLGPDFKIFNNVAIHKSVSIDSNAILKGPAIISENCFVGAHCYIRGGAFLDENVSLGPGCEVKSTILFANSALGHFNFVGDSIIGESVNLEAGAVVANHFNERADKTIFVVAGDTTWTADTSKFGALVGDGCKIGANAVLSPGTVLAPGSVVKRLQLVEQHRPG